MEQINVAELLKDCPKGMELDCSIYDNVSFVEVINSVDYPIVIKTKSGFSTRLTKYGQNVTIDDAKCVILPKGKTTWEGFHRPFVDGDIVAIDSAGGSQVFIFKEYIEEKEDYAICYMMLDDDGAVDFEGGDYYVERFASREEQERLFEAIKEKGYRWDPVNDTLEKLIEPKFKVGDKVRHKNNHGVVFTITSIEEDSYVCGAKAAFWFDDQDDYELVPNKFDITTLKPFDKVLARDTDNSMWIATLFSHLRGMTFYTVSSWYNQCIPFQGNEHLLGTTNDCEEFYKTWE